jgi:hypothetical protein
MESPSLTLQLQRCSCDVGKKKFTRDFREREHSAIIIVHTDSGVKRSESEQDAAECTDRSINSILDGS